MVGTDRTRPVARVCLELHQRAVPGLFQRSQADPAACRLRRPGQVTGSRPRLADQVAQLDALGLQLRPDVQQPVLIHPGQEISPILGHGAGGMPENPLVIVGRRRRQGSPALKVEDAGVDTARLGIAPAQIPGGHQQRGLRAQHLTQMMQLAAQIGQRLRLCRVGPQQARDPLPGLR